MFAFHWKLGSADLDMEKWCTAHVELVGMMSKSGVCYVCFQLELVLWYNFRLSVLRGM